jgi:hypothetical protein
MGGHIPPIPGANLPNEAANDKGEFWGDQGIH